MKILFVDKVHSFLHERLIKNGNKCVNAFHQSKKEIEKNVFLAGPYGNKINCYCLGEEKEFVDLVKDYFLIKEFFIINYHII